MADTIALLNMKGGVGKTTLAVNLAWHAFKRARKSVILIDFDPQFNASQYLMDFKSYSEHASKNGTIADVLIDTPTFTLRKKSSKPSVRKCIAQVGDDGSARFDVLPSELALSHVVKNPAQMDYRLEKLLTPIRKDYDFVFIDCAPTDSVLTSMTLNASDFLLIPIRPDRFSILGFGMVLETIEQFRQNCPNPHDVKDLGVVFTQVHKNKVDHECIAEIKAIAARRGTHVFASQLGFSPTFARAVQQQTPAFETKYARDELKQSIAAVAREMNTRIEVLKKG